MKTASDWRHRNTHHHVGTIHRACAFAYDLVMGFWGQQKLSGAQLRARNDLRLKIATGQYRTIANPCVVCEEGVELADQIDKVIAEVDRYGIPIRTVMCNKCGMLRTDPIFRDSDYSDFYKYYYRELHSGLVEASNDFFEEQIKRGKQLRNLINNHTDLIGKTIIEVGTGAGGILQGVVGDDADGIGCDFGFSYLKFAQSKSLRVFQGSISSVSDDSADVLIYSHVLEHIANPKNEIREMFRVLKDNGLVVLVVPGVYSIHRHYGGRLSQYLQSAHLHHYTRQHLRKLMEDGGFLECYGSQGVTAIFAKKVEGTGQAYLLPPNLARKSRKYFAILSVTKVGLSVMLYFYLMAVKAINGSAK